MPVKHRVAEHRNARQDVTVRGDRDVRHAVDGVVVWCPRTGCPAPGGCEGSDRRAILVELVHDGGRVPSCHGVHQLRPARENRVVVQHVDRGVLLVAATATHARRLVDAVRGEGGIQGAVEIEPSDELPLQIAGRKSVRPANHDQLAGALQGGIPDHDVVAVGDCDEGLSPGAVCGVRSPAAAAAAEGNAQAAHSATRTTRERIKEPILSKTGESANHEGQASKKSMDLVPSRPRAPPEEQNGEGGPPPLEAAPLPRSHVT